MDQNHLLSRKDIQESKARIDIYSSSYRPHEIGKMRSQKREGSGQIASIDIPFAQLVSQNSTGQVKLLENSKAMYWSALCINGRTTLNDLHSINELTHTRPEVTKVCKSEFSPMMKK